MAADARVAKRQRSFHTDDRGTFEDKPETVLHTTAGDIEKSPRSLNGLRLADSHAGDKLGQEGAESRTGSLIQSSRVVRLPGRDVSLVIGLAALSFAQPHLQFGPALQLQIWLKYNSSIMRHANRPEVMTCKTSKMLL